MSSTRSAARLPRDDGREVDLARRNRSTIRRCPQFQTGGRSSPGRDRCEHLARRFDHDSSPEISSFPAAIARLRVHHNDGPTEQSGSGLRDSRGAFTTRCDLAISRPDVPQNRIVVVSLSRPRIRIIRSLHGRIGKAHTRCDLELVAHAGRLKFAPRRSRRSQLQTRPTKFDVGRSDAADRKIDRSASLA